MTEHGTIVDWREEKNYGFIKPDHSNDEDLFFHASELIGDRSLLETGDRVSYELGKDRKTGRDRAIKVALIIGRELPRSANHG